MKKLSCYLSILALSALSAHANLIVNSGFEDDSVSTAPWATGGAGATLSINSTTASSGSQSGEFGFTADLDKLNQGLFIAPEARLQTYTFSFSVNTEATGYTSEPLVLWLQVGEWNGVDGIVYQEGAFETIAAGTVGWTAISQEFTLTQADGTYIDPTIYFFPNGAGGPDAAGSVLIDDVSFTAIPEPGAYALLGGMLALGSVMIRRRR